MDEHTKLSYYKINNQCPFLNQKENYCYVYKARPIACRMHFVESKPSLCNPKNTSGGVVRWSHSEAYTKINPALEGIEQKYDMVPEKAPFETFNRIYLWEKGTNFLLK